MNKTNEHLIQVYASGDHKNLHEEINGLSKENLSSAFIDLITQYINDRNSSTLREIIIVKMSGYELIEEKLGYNGYRQSVPNGTKEYCEAKPVNIRKDEHGQYSRKFNGAGNFSDYTPERLEKDLEDNPQMLVGGFADGRLIYIFSFPFSCLEVKLAKNLYHQFHGKERPTGQYLRSANFSFKDYENCSDFKIVYVINNLDQYRECFTLGFFKWIGKYSHD